jgi:hypothetical protein
MKPTIILRPNVHMSSLLRFAGVTAASLNEFNHERNADDGTNHVRGTHHLRDVRAHQVCFLRCVNLCERNSEVAFEVVDGQPDRLFGSAQRQPPSLVCTRAVTQERRQAVNGNEAAADSGDPK